MRRIAILGSTGSIGRSTLTVAESYPDRFQIVALAAGSNLNAAFEQALRWKPRVLSIAREADADALRHKLKGEGFASEVRLRTRSIRMTVGPMEARAPGYCSPKPKGENILENSID